MDFADLREYQPGDDVRYIDWNVTARMDAPYVREYVEDREITAWFLLDLSPSVDFGTVDASGSKRTRADRLRDDAGAAADAPRQPGRRGLLRQPGRADDPGRGGRIQVLRLVNDLLGAAAPHRRAPRPTWRRCSRPASRRSRAARWCS